MDPELQALYDEIMNAEPDPRPPVPMFRTKKAAAPKEERGYGRWHPTPAQLERARPRLILSLKGMGLFGCWEFQGRRSRFGHGQLSIGDRRIGAHRIAYLLWRGHFDPELVIRHRCDNPACCNPAHLVPGTVQQNVDDMIERGRAAFQRPGWNLPPSRLGCRRIK